MILTRQLAKLFRSAAPANAKPRTRPGPEPMDTGEARGVRITSQDPSRRPRKVTSPRYSRPVFYGSGFALNQFHLCAINPEVGNLDPGRVTAAQGTGGAPGGAMTGDIRDLDPVLIAAGAAQGYDQCELAENLTPPRGIRLSLGGGGALNEPQQPPGAFVSASSAGYPEGNRGAWHYPRDFPRPDLRFPTGAAMPPGLLQGYRDYAAEINEGVFAPGDAWRTKFTRWHRSEERHIETGEDGVEPDMQDVPDRNSLWAIVKTPGASAQMTYGGVAYDVYIWQQAFAGLRDLQFPVTENVQTTEGEILAAEYEAAANNPMATDAEFWEAYFALMEVFSKRVTDRARFDMDIQQAAYDFFFDQGGDPDHFDGWRTRIPPTRFIRFLDSEPNLGVITLSIASSLANATPDSSRPFDPGRLGALNAREVTAPDDGQGVPRPALVRQYPGQIDPASGNPGAGWRGIF